MKIYLAGGCFWGVEEYFKHIPGVIKTSCGYANSDISNPTYEQVCNHITNAVETICIEYDPQKITLSKILKAYFIIIDPCSINKQGNDQGTQYRTGIYFTNEEAKNISFVNEYITNKVQPKFNEKVRTEVMILKNYYLAESYHQNYLAKNPGGYCHIDVEKSLSEYNQNSEDTPMFIPITLSNGKKIDVECEIMGKGTKTLMFLHGGPGAQYKSFLPFLKDLERTYRLIFYNQIGCGKTTNLLETEYHIKYEYEIINQLKQRFATSDFNIIGESWGTILGLGYFSHYSVEINNLILCSSVAYKTEHFSLFQQGMERKITQHELKSIELLNQEFKNNQITQEEYIKQRQNVLEILYLYNPQNKSKIQKKDINFKQNQIVFNLIDKEMDLEHKLPLITSNKIHWLQAEDDFVRPQDIKEIFAPIIVNELITIPKCGHWIYLEQTKLLKKIIDNIIK